MPKTETERKIQTSTFYRSIEIRKESINQESRTVEVSFSSEEPVERFFGNEILDHQPGSMDLSRLESGAAPVLVDHWGDQVGVVEKAWLDQAQKKGRAVLRFSKSARGQEVFQDIQDGIRKNTSVGYVINEMRLDGSKDDENTYRATDWQPHEISIVSVPADNTVGVGRSREEKTITTLIKGVRSMPDENEPKGSPAPGTVMESRDEILKKDRERVKEINAIAERYPQMRASADQHIADGKSPAEFGWAVLRETGNAKPLSSMPSPEIGMSDREIARFSIRKAINDIVEFRGLQGFEKEVSAAAAKKLGRYHTPTSFTIPQDVTQRGRMEMTEMALRMMGFTGKRALGVTASNLGGYTVDTEVMGQNLIELLRNMMVVQKLGPMNLSGLDGNVAIPRQTAAGTAYWLAEGAAITRNDQTFGQVLLSPHRLGGATAYSKELLVQSSIDVEGFIRMDLMKILAIAKDLAALAGTGNAGQPTGILNTTGVLTLTFGAAATWAKIIQFESDVAGQNALLGNLGYISTPATRGKLKTAQKATNYPSYIWEGSSNPDGSGGVVNGYQAWATNQMPGNQVIFGNWADLILADWAGIDILVDPYSLSLNGQVSVVAQILTDVGVRHPVSFEYSTDSGAQ